MKIGFIYAGQGSQKVGMGKDFYENYPAFAKTMDQASDSVKEVTDFDVKDLCFNGPVETLSSTRYTQPCMVSYAVGVTKLLKEAGINPDYVCGLSLGEYSALYAADVLSEEDVLNLVAYRGKVMEEAVSGREVGMAAVLMLDRENVLACCERANEELKDEFVMIDGQESKEHYLVSAANFNCPGQIVISGDKKAVDLASQYLKEAGAKRVLPLKVSGPFHTSLMKPAGDALKERFQSVDFMKPTANVVFNATGEEMADTSDFSKEVKLLLEKQVQSSVYLEDSISYMAKQGVDTIIEIGPGNATSKFVKKTASDIAVYSIDNVDDLQTVISELAS